MSNVGGFSLFLEGRKPDDMFAMPFSQFCSHCGRFLPRHYVKCPGCSQVNRHHRPVITHNSGMQFGFPLSHLVWIYLPLWLVAVLLGQYLVRDDVVFDKHAEIYWANRYWAGMLRWNQLEYFYEIKRGSGYIYCIVLWREGNYYVRIPVAEVEKAGTPHIKAWINEHLSWADSETKNSELEWLDKELLILSGWPANEPLSGFARWWSENIANFSAPQGVSGELAKFRQEEFGRFSQEKFDREGYRYAHWMHYVKRGTWAKTWMSQRRQLGLANIMSQLYFVVLAYLLIQGIRCWFRGPRRFRKLLLTWYVWLSLPLFLLVWGGRHANLYTPVEPFWPTHELVAYVLWSLAKWHFPLSGLVVFGLIVYLTGAAMDHWNTPGISRKLDSRRE